MFIMCSHCVPVRHSHACRGRLRVNPARYLLSDGTIPLLAVIYGLVAWGLVLYLKRPAAAPAAVVVEG